MRAVTRAEYVHSYAGVECEHSWQLKGFLLRS
jgi:hypothetical protein